MRRLLVLAAGCALLAPVSAVRAHPLPRAPGCRIFPANSPWNQRVDGLPVARNSPRAIAAIGLDDPVHPDFGSGFYGGQLRGRDFEVVDTASLPHPGL